MHEGVSLLNHDKCLFTCLAKSSWTERFSMVWHRSGALAIGKTKQLVSLNLSKQNSPLKEKKAGKMQFITYTFHIHKIQHNI